MWRPFHQFMNYEPPYGGGAVHKNRSFRGAAKGREPGTHEHRPLEYGFRVRRFASPRNDDFVQSPAAGSVANDPKNAIIVRYMFPDDDDGRPEDACPPARKAGDDPRKCTGVNRSANPALFLARRIRRSGLAIRPSG